MKNNVLRTVIAGVVVVSSGVASAENNNTNSKLEVELLNETSTKHLSVENLERVKELKPSLFDANPLLACGDYCPPPRRHDDEKRMYQEFMEKMMQEELRKLEEATQVSASLDSMFS